MKSGSRTIEGWIKALPDPESDEAFHSFEEKLIKFYNISMKNYLDRYENSFNHRDVILSKGGNQIINIQSRWLTQLRDKVNNSMDQHRRSCKFYLEEIIPTLYEDR